jgi:protein SCO1/2
MTRAFSVIFVTLLVIACAPRTSLSGTVLEPKDAADFTLTDALSGDPVTLSLLRGRVVALSFLYTHCPDTCPLTAAKFRAAQQTMGTDAVHFVAVSVDPDGDTPTAVRAFSEKHDLSAGWRYLIGTRSQLEAVWALYGVGAFGRSMDGVVDHNDAIYVIDRQGRERELVHSDIAVADLVKDLRALSEER